tara:strand:+ start:257 stop:454 length:198 start_codon:yes stop_codon:yes gene_type:complete
MELLHLFQRSLQQVVAVVHPTLVEQVYQVVQAVVEEINLLPHQLVEVETFLLYLLHKDKVVVQEM